MIAFKGVTSGSIVPCAQCKSDVRHLPEHRRILTYSETACHCQQAGVASESTDMLRVENWKSLYEPVVQVRHERDGKKSSGGLCRGGTVAVPSGISFALPPARSLRNPGTLSRVSQMNNSEIYGRLTSDPFYQRAPTPLETSLTRQPTASSDGGSPS